jgi:hypothetical protein
VWNLRAYLIITRFAQISGDRIIAGCKRLYLNDLIQKQEEKRRIWKKLFI